MKNIIISALSAFALSACSNAEDSATSASPNASKAKSGAVTIRVVGAEFKEGGKDSSCLVTLAEMNNSGRNLDRFQISKIEAKTSRGSTSDHSTSYGELNAGESRQSGFYIKASSCDELKEITIVTLLCKFSDSLSSVCDDNTEYVFEGGKGIQLISTFSPIKTG